MTTSRKLWLGFGALTALLVVAGATLVARAPAMGARSVAEYALLLLLAGGILAALTGNVIGRGVAQAQRRVEDARRFAVGVMETVREPLLVLDGTLRVVRANRSFYQTFAVASEETEGRPLRELGDGQWDLPSLRALLQEVLAQNAEVRDFDVEHDFPGVGWRIMRLDARRLALEGGDAALVLLAIHDVTDRERAERAVREGARRLRLVMDSLPQKIVTAGPGGEADYYNPQWLGYAGPSLEQTQAGGWMRLVHPDDLGETERLWARSLATGEPHRQERRLRRADGEYRWHLGHAVALRDPGGEVVMWVGSDTDVHEQRQAADGLRRLAADLSEADRRKDEFLAMLAHELRNPLAPIRNASQMLALRADDPAVVAQAGGVIERQSAQMTRLVDELLDASRIARGKVALRRGRLDLAALARAVAGDHRAALEAGGLALAVEVPAAAVWVEGDAARLSQILGNLLHNSTKFTDPGGRVTVRACRDGGVAALAVEDTGVGIDPSALPKLFEEFSQVDATIERSKGGLGLGLAVVKGLAELHGGTVEAASAGLGKGATFTVRLPLSADEAAGAAAPASQAAPASHPTERRRVLVVEDGEDAAESLRVLLEMRGFGVSVARCGPEGVEAARRLRPDAVVCDLGLPGMSGFEVARALRADPQTAGALLVCLSGYAQEEDRKRALEAGFDAHLAKGADAAALFRVLESGRPAGASQAPA